MIPKILHVVWCGPHVVPMNLIETWEKKHVNGWFFTLWRDHKDGWINQEQINARANRREWNGVADIMRHEILAKHGGFAVDADSECLIALDEGPEDFISSNIALGCEESALVRPGMIGCGFLGAPKNSPFFKECVEEVGRQDPGLIAWKAVGPGLMGRVAEKMPDQIRVLPAKMFNPVHYTGTEAAGNHPVYARQYWGSSKTGGYNSLRKIGCVCPECAQTMLRPTWG